MKSSITKPFSTKFFSKIFQSKILDSVRFKTLFLFATTIAIGSCGGGSAGTGTTTFSGKLLTTDNVPVQGAVVRVEGSTETATTDEQGRFSLITNEQSEDVRLQVQTEDVNTSVSIPTPRVDDSKVGVQLELNTSTATVSVKSLEVTSEIIGACKDSFVRNGGTLVQVKKIKDETLCTARVSARSAGNNLSGISVVIQRRACPDTPDTDNEWISVASGKTQQARNPGVAEFNFKFFDDTDHCQYRIVAPYKDSERTSVIFPIVTLREQLSSQ